METLKKHLPFSGSEAISELNRIAARFEEDVFATASSQVIHFVSQHLFHLCVCVCVCVVNIEISKEMDSSTFGTRKAYRCVVLAFSI